MLKQLWNAVFLACIDSNNRIKFIISSSACLQQRVMDPLIPTLFLRAHFLLHSCFSFTVEEMPEELTASKTVYQQEEFSVKPKEREKCLSKTYQKRKSFSHKHNHYKTLLQTNIISTCTKIPTFEKSKLWLIPPP